MERISKRRFDNCISIGRRFWGACQIFRRHADVNNIKYNFNVTTGEIRGSHFGPTIIMSRLDDDIFSYSQLERFKELFSCYHGNFYINVVKFDSYYMFSNLYGSIFTDAQEDLKRKVYENVCNKVPLEINLFNIRIQDRRSRRKILKNDATRHPLIEAMYYSDELVDFIKKFTADLICSPAYHIFEGVGGRSDQPERLPEHLLYLFNNVDQLTYDRTTCFKDRSNRYN